MSFKGRKFTIEHKEKLRQAKLGKPLIRSEIGKQSFKEKMTGEKHPMWKGGIATLICEECNGFFEVKPYRKDVARFCSKLCKTNNSNQGRTPANEKIRKSQAYKAWRTLVFERDNYTCQDCKIVGGYLHVDHIKPFALYSKERLNIQNGRTLCVPCHKKTNTYGRRSIYRKENDLLALLNNF